MNKKFTISVGIPTYELGNSLVQTLQSLYAQTTYEHIEKILVVIDSSRVTKEYAQRIKNKKLKLRYFQTRKGQSARLNDIFKELNNQLVILTNDDVILKKNALEMIIECYQKTQADLISGQTVPISPETVLEKSLRIGSLINDIIARSWKGGDNYLSVNGRFIALSKNLYKKVTVPQNLWNNDAYLYLFTKLNEFFFTRCEKAISYYQLPTVFTEHVNQSVRFANSYQENQGFFSKNISHFYSPPFLLSLSAALQIFFKNPIYFSTYLLILFFTRIRSRFTKLPRSKKGFWETDVSTKNIKL